MGSNTLPTSTLPPGQAPPSPQAPASPGPQASGLSQSKANRSRLRIQPSSVTFLTVSTSTQPAHSNCSPTPWEKPWSDPQGHPAPHTAPPGPSYHPGNRPHSPVLLTWQHPSLSGCAVLSCSVIVPGHCPQGSRPKPLAVSSLWGILHQPQAQAPGTAGSVPLSQGLLPPLVQCPPSLTTQPPVQAQAVWVFPEAWRPAWASTTTVHMAEGWWASQRPQGPGPEWQVGPDLLCPHPTHRPQALIQDLCDRSQLLLTSAHVLSV